MIKCKLMLYFKYSSMLSVIHQEGGDGTPFLFPLHALLKIKIKTCNIKE